MAVPRLADEATRLASPDDRARARQHVAATRFEEVGADLLGALGTAFERVGEMFADDDGESRRDWRRKGDDRDPESLLLEETVLPVGATATAAGWWSTDRQAVVPDWERRDRPPSPSSPARPSGSPARPTRFRSSAWSVVVAATLLTGLGRASSGSPSPGACRPCRDRRP